MDDSRADALLPVVAIVPMKPIRLAKTRLAPRLGPAERADLTAAMLSWVLSALRASSVERVVVVGGDEPIREVAKSEGAEWEPDIYLDLNQALTNAFRSAWADGYAAAYLPGDLPLIQSYEVDMLVRRSARGECIAICPAHDGGTNGLVVPPSMPLDARLGPDSFRRHRRAAAESGYVVKEFRSAGFDRDVDTIEDLAACIARGAKCLDGFADSTLGRLR